MAIYSDLHIMVILTKVAKTKLLISFATELGCVLSKLTNVDINEGEIPFVLKQANTDQYLPTWTDLKKQNVKRGMSI